MNIDEAAERELYPKEHLRLGDRPELVWKTSWIFGYAVGAFLALLLLRWIIRAYVKVWKRG